MALHQPPLTRTAKARLMAHLNAGDLVVDATVGTGRDTLFLAEQVGATGRVWGFDVQTDALTQARTLLEQHQLTERVQLLHSGHEHLSTQLPPEAQGQLSAVMFNLGYLPGSNQEITTQADTTLPALIASMMNLRLGGLLSVLVYRQHPGGQSEAAAVSHWLTSQCTESMSVETIDTPGPVLYLAIKR